MTPILTGYHRPDGRVGLRNHLLVIATCGCAYQEALRIADAVPGALAITHWESCGADPMLILQLSGIANNPNIAATLLVGHGCETLTVDLLAERIRPSGKPLAQIVIQEVGGTLRAIEQGTRLLRGLSIQVSDLPRLPATPGQLLVAVECGGSDATSGLAANPAIGVAVDRLVDAGATVMFTETMEMTGTGHILARRAVNEEVAQRIHAILADREKWMRATGQPSRHMPQGNMDGGLTTIEEKSLGAIRKGGTRAIQGVLENSRERLERPTHPGLWIQDGAEDDLPSMTHMVAAGAQLIIFSTGRGSTAGHAFAPVIKVTGNPQTYARLEDNMDINAGRIIEGAAGITEVGAEIEALVWRVANGLQTKAESLGLRDYNIFHRNAVATALIGRYCQ